MLKLFSVVVLHRSMGNWRKLKPWCMCILLYVISLFSIILVAEICLLDWMGSPFAMGICAFCYMLKLFSVNDII